MADLLVDAVDTGASVNFMAGFTRREACTFWLNQIPELRTGARQLFVADDGTRILATVVLTFAPQPNAPHRGEITKMIVHSSMRRQGIGQRILSAAEDAARAAGRTLLLLDTESDTAGEALYRRCGWIEYGRVPGHAHKTDGRLAETTFFYKELT